MTSEKISDSRAYSLFACGPKLLALCPGALRAGRAASGWFCAGRVVDKL
jgi:hypothetical protein